MALQQLTPEDFVSLPGTGQNPALYSVLGLPAQASVDEFAAVKKAYNQQFGEGAYENVHQQGEDLYQQIHSLYDFNAGKYLPGGIEKAAQLLPSQAQYLSRSIAGQNPAPSQNVGASTGSQFEAASSPVQEKTLSAPASNLTRVQQARANLAARGIANPTTHQVNSESLLIGRQLKGSATTSPLVATDPVTGLQSINTGNPQTDKVINEQYLPLVHKELTENNPGGIIDPANVDDALSKADQYVKDNFGDQLDTARANIERDYGLKTQDITASAKQEAGDIGLGLTRAEEDKVRNLADSARNYDEHQLQTRENFRQRGLTFSGLREEAAQKLTDQQALDEGKINQDTQRSKEDLQRKLNAETGGLTLDDINGGGTIGGSYGRQLTDASNNQTDELAKNRALGKAYEADALSSYLPKSNIQQTEELFK